MFLFSNSFPHNVAHLAIEFMYAGTIVTELLSIHCWDLYKVSILWDIPDLETMIYPLLGAQSISPFNVDEVLFCFLTLGDIER